MNARRERGSIEVVILVIVFAVVIGLIFWRYSEAEKAQIDAENAANSEVIEPPAPTHVRVEVPEMALTFEAPENAGEITYEVNASGAAQLKSSKLAQDRSDCEEDHDGKFALLRTANAEDASVSGDFKKTVDGVEYIVQVDYQTCYTDADREEFDQVAAHIAQSLAPLAPSNGGNEEDPNTPVTNER